MVTGYALPDFRPVVVRVTSFSEAAASIRSWVKEAINFLYRGHPRPNFIGYDPRTVELRLGRFVVLGAGSTALVALLSASVLYLLPSAGAGVGGGALGWVEGAPSQMKPPVDNPRHLYVLDGRGGMHPLWGSPRSGSTRSACRPVTRLLAIATSTRRRPTLSTEGESRCSSVTAHPTSWGQEEWPASTHRRFAASRTWATRTRST